MSGLRLLEDILKKQYKIQNFKKITNINNQLRVSLERGLTYPSYGLRIFNSPVKDKSDIVRNVAHSLYIKKIIKGALYLDAKNIDNSSFSYNSNILDNQSLGKIIKMDNMNNNYNNYNNYKSIVLIIDNIDPFYYENREECKTFIRELIKDSLYYKNYVSLLCVNDIHLSKIIGKINNNIGFVENNIFYH